MAPSWSHTVYISVIPSPSWDHFQWPEVQTYDKQLQRRCASPGLEGCHRLAAGPQLKEIAALGRGGIWILSNISNPQLSLKSCSAACLSYRHSLHGESVSCLKSRRRKTSKFCVKFFHWMRESRSLGYAGYVLQKWPCKTCICSHHPSSSSGGRLSGWHCSASAR